MPCFPSSYRWFWAGRTVSPTRMQWPSRFPLALQQSSHDHPLHSSGQHFSYGFSLGFTRTSRQTLPRASIAVVPIVAASIKMLGTMLWCGFIPKSASRSVEGILLSRSGSYCLSYQPVRRKQRNHLSGRPPLECRESLATPMWRSRSQGVIMQPYLWPSLNQPSAPGMSLGLRSRHFRVHSIRRHFPAGRGSLPRNR